MALSIDIPLFSHPRPQGYGTLCPIDRNYHSDLPRTFSQQRCQHSNHSQKDFLEDHEISDVHERKESHLDSESFYLLHQLIGIEIIRRYCQQKIRDRLQA